MGRSLSVRLDEAEMSSRQWGVVAIMVALNALDGFDVLSISFASPGIAESWNIDRAALGLILSMELIGMAVGSLLLGNIADRHGRRATILGCLMLMTLGMLGAATSTGIASLSGWRILTGLGIGGMLATTNAAVAEVSNKRHRPLAVVLMAAGYPMGTIVGGSISAILLASFSWQAIFLFGAFCSLAFIPLVLWRVPESVDYLLAARPPAAFEEINKSLTKLGQPTLDALPPRADALPKPTLASLFVPRLRAATILLTVAYLFHIMTFLFIVKWIPKLVVDMGHAPTEAASVLVWASVGGAAGSLLLGLATRKFRVQALTIGAMLLSVGMVILFGRGQTSLDALSLVAAAAGFCTNAAVVGLYALIAESFPAALRGTGTGFVIGFGRGGSALAPALAGLLFAAGYGLQAVAGAMALGSVVGAAALTLLARFAFFRSRLSSPGD